MLNTVVLGSGEYRPPPPEPHEGQEDVLAHLDLTTDERTGLGLPAETAA